MPVLPFNIIFFLIFMCQIDLTHRGINRTILNIVHQLDICSIIWENIHFWLATLTTIVSFLIVSRKVSAHIATSASLHLQNNEKILKMTSKMRKVSCSLLNFNFVIELNAVIDYFDNDRF